MRRARRAAYAGGFVLIEVIVHLLYDAWHALLLLSLAVLAPAEASNVMITAGRAFPASLRRSDVS